MAYFSSLNSAPVSSNRKSPLAFSFLTNNLLKCFIVCAMLLVWGVGSVSGQISTLNTWSNLYHNTATTQQNITYTIPGGSNVNRVLVVAIATSRTSVGARNVTLTYGGQTLTSVNGDISITTPQQHTQLYYLNEAGLDAAISTTLSVTVATGTTRITDIFATVFDNVDQATPIVDSKTYSSGTSNTTNPVFGTALTVNANNQAVEIVSNMRLANNNPRTTTYATNWTMINEQTYLTTDGVRNGVANRSIPGANTTDQSSTTFGGNALGSMTAMSLKYYVPKYFRSLATGNWNATTTWQQSYDNISWTPATNIPSSSDISATIINGNTVTLTANATTSNLIVNGGGAIDVNTFVLTGTGSMTIASTATLYVGGTSNFPTGFTTTTLSLGSTVNYDYLGPQTVSNQTYSNLTLSGSGAKSVTTGTTISNNLSISGATASISAGISVSAAKLTLGNLNTNSGTWGSTSSAAVNTDNTYFSATTGVVNVGSDTRSLTPTFSGLTTSQSICFGTTQVTLSGTISAAGPVYPANGEIVAVTINGTSQNASISGAVGGFTINYTTASIATGNYAISYSFAGDKYLKTATTDASTSLTVNANPAAPTTTGAYICIGTTSGTILSASGAITGQKYNWYSAASGGTLLYTSTDNTVNTYTTPVLGATTSNWVTIINAGGCESSRIQVTATYPSLSVEDQTLAGTDSWISHIYEGSNSAVAYNGIFTNYFGHSTEVESFDESFGGDTNCYPFTSSSIAETILTETFSVRFRMNSTKKGLWIVDLGSDDGNRLTVDGTLIYNDWTGHAVNNNLKVLMSLTGSSSLTYDYFENGGGNRIYYKNITQILGNTLSTNTSQTINTGNAGVAISGDTYGTLPTGITLSGTGYQWVYSSTPGGATTNITGATGATFTPNTSTAPFNTPGTYYVYRNAVLSSTNNISPNPYVATNTSNSAIITIIGTPIITASVSTLTGFTYVSGSGPSTEQSFTVSGINLTTNIIVTPPANFEISTGTGSSFVPQNLITLNVVNSNVATTTIYTRMKAGLLTTPLDLPENIALTSTGATTQNVGCSGSVIIQPVITTSTAPITTPTSLSGFNYNFDPTSATASAVQSFNVSGDNLSGNIVITPPANYQICLTSNGTFSSTPITLTPSGGIVASRPIYVQLMKGLVVNTYSGNIVLTSPFATTQNVFCSGSVTAPIITVSTFNLGGFIYTLGALTSASQQFSVSGSFLTNNVTVTAPLNYEISINDITYSGTITLTPTDVYVEYGKTIYVRLKSGLATATYGPLNLTVVSTGAITQNVICSGQVVNTATLLSSVNSLNGFMYLYDSGITNDQFFTVSGASLTANITVTPPANYEISNDNGLSYSTTAITLTRVNNTVNPTTFYIHLINGLPVGTYAGNLVIKSNLLTLNVACNGKVLDVPTLTAGASPGSSVCVGNAVTLNTTHSAGVTNIYWTGPDAKAYYSQSATPSVPLLGGTVTTSDSGIYTATGSLLSGVNLLTNGSFESGNTGFGSSYSYVTPSLNALSPEKLYTITGSASYPYPSSVHGGTNQGFGDCTAESGSYEMVINGAPQAGVIVWSESVSVQTGTDYQFTYYVESVNPAAPSQLQLYVNGVPAGPVYTASNVNCTWTKFTYNTNSGLNSVMQLTLINQNTAQAGNDFALDDMVFQPIFQVQSSVNLVVNPVLAPTLTVTASSNPVYTNTPVTFTATPTNGGATPTYQWSTTNPVTTGPTTPTYTFTPTTGQVVKCIMTSSLPCANPLTATNTVTMTVNPRSNYWVGSAGANGTDWGTPTNWSANIIPAPGNDVEYATTGNGAGKMAVNNLQLDQDHTIGSLINATPQSLIIPAGKGLIVNQTISTNNDPALINIKSSPLNKNGSLIYHNPQSNPVFATVEMYSLASYDINGPVNGKYKWQYFGIPLSSLVANPTFYGSYVRSWDESGTSINNHWVSLNNFSTLLPFNGYEITQKNATTIVFQGQLVNSNSNFGQLSVTPTALYPGEHIYANPYTAAIDIRLLDFGSDTEATVYLYNTGSYNDWLPNGQNSPGTNPGQYTAVPKNTAGNGAIPRQIPSMQGFMIKAMTAATTPNCTFGITYNAVVMNNSDAQRAPGMYATTDEATISTRIDLNGTNYGDRMWLFTQAGCTTEFDNGWDGRKMTGDALTPQLFAIEPDGNYQVDALNDINNTSLGFQAGSDTEYTMTFTHTKIASNYSALYLVDLVDNKTVDITQSGSTYSFVSESTPAPVKRFMIATRNIEKNAPDANTDLKVFSSGHVVFVQNLGSLNGEMVVYDMTGRILKRAKFGPLGVTDIQLSGIPGAYVVSASTNNERVSKRVIIGN